MPGDFREFFDLRKLDQQQIGEIEFILNSPAYDHSFKPYIKSVLYSMHRLWMDRSEQRKATYPDDYLAGGATFGEGLLKFFDLLVSETSLERIHASMSQMTGDNLYDMARERGDVKPIVGLDQSASPEPVRPEDDF